MLLNTQFVYALQNVGMDSARQRTLTLFPQCVYTLMVRLVCVFILVLVLSAPFVLGIRSTCTNYI